MDFITAGKAIDNISSFLGLTRENDLAKLFLYLDLAQKRAWKAGDYKGFMREATLNVRSVGGRRFLITPHGYNVLKGININNKPKRIVESYFSFHHNSMGSLSDDRALNYTDAVVEYRESATILPNDTLFYNKPFKIGVVARNGQDVGVEVDFKGLAADGRPVHTSVASSSTMLSGLDEFETIYGARIKTEPNKMILMSDVNWLHISSITKGASSGDLDVYAVYDECVYHIASLSPFQSRSLYRIYEIPKGVCSQHTDVEALLRISEPDPINSESQSLIIDDMEALLSLVMSIDQTFDKKDITMGTNFGILGLGSLDAELKSSRAPTLKPIQIIETEETTLMGGMENIDFLP